MQRQSAFRKWMGLITLGYTGGSIFVLMYIRYVFYDQMMQTMQVTNTQLALLTTVSGVMLAIVKIPGAVLSDKFDAKKIIVFSIGGITVITFVFAAFITSYTMALVLWGCQAAVLFAYWPCLIKYVNNLGGEDEAGNSFGIYYLINGLSGALGNALPLWVCTRYGFRAAIISVGVMTLVATILVIFFLDDEKKLAEKGVFLKGDEPIRLSHFKYVLKWPGMYIMFFAYFAAYTLYSNVSYFNPYLMDVVGINPDTSSVYAVIRSYGAMLVAPVGGIMADKVFKSSSKWFIVAFSVSAVMFAVPFLFGPDSNATLVSIYSLLPSLVIFALYSVTYSILRELHIPPTVAGTCIGLSSISVVLVDAIWPAVFGSFIDNYGNSGYTYIFICLIATAVFGVIVSLWARSHDKKCREGRRELVID